MLFWFFCKTGAFVDCLKGIYDFCALKKDGFIHCSDKTQFVRIANNIFKDKKNVVLLEINESKVKAKIVYENLYGGNEDFPHIYGPLDIDSVNNVFDFYQNNNGEFVSPL